VVGFFYDITGERGSIPQHHLTKHFNMKKILFFALLLFAACKPTPEYIPQSTVVLQDPLTPKPKVKGFDISKLGSPIRRPEYCQPLKEPIR